MMTSVWWWWNIALNYIGWRQRESGGDWSSREEGRGKREERRGRWKRERKREHAIRTLAELLHELEIGENLVVGIKGWRNWVRNPVYLSLIQIQIQRREGRGCEAKRKERDEAEGMRTKQSSKQEKETAAEDGGRRTEGVRAWGLMIDKEIQRMKEKGE